MNPPFSQLDVHGADGQSQRSGYTVHPPSAEVPLKDTQTVTSGGESTRPLILGVRIINVVTQPDARGSLTQLPAELFEEPVVDAHQVSIRPGKVKGWIVHYKQLDRLFFWQGDFRVVLYDGRPESSSHGMINDLCFGEVRPVLCFIPKGVYHAIQNVGQTVASHMSFPTTPYNYEDPDKFRLPLETKQIPFDFNKLGW